MTNISLIFLDPTSSTNTFIIKGHYFWEADRNCKYFYKNQHWLTERRSEWSLKSLKRTPPYSQCTIQALTRQRWRVQLTTPSINVNLTPNQKYHLRKWKATSHNRIYLSVWGTKASRDLMKGENSCTFLGVHS